MDEYSYLGNADPGVIEDLYSKYLKDPNSVDPSWAHFFEGFDFGRKSYDGEQQVPDQVLKEFKVLNLIHGYRTRGHLFTKTNPVRERRKYSPNLDIENFGLEEGDLDTEFNAGEEIGVGTTTLRNIIDHLQETYCQSIGIEYMYIRDPERQGWIREKIEIKNRPQFNKDLKLRIFRVLNNATLFEQYLQKKFIGQKRFSIEGGESLMTAIDTVVMRSGDLGIKEIVVGMAHRGRLNVLHNIFQKKAREIFGEFEGKEYDQEGLFDGDVKYHLGYTSEVQANGKGNLQLTISPNPSHLEAVDPIVEGITRAKIEHHHEGESEVLPILVHGDAAIAAQGVAYEVVQMAQLDGYRTGGTIHLVVNNQVGFTTNYLDGRSSTYCTDVGKTTLCPVFHVNGDDVEAMVQTLSIALEYRQRFHRDVFIDILCYRKYGHNEGDEPKFTQPKLYDIIAKHPNPREIYLKQLIEEKVITEKEADKMKEEYEKQLDEEFQASKDQETVSVKHFLEDLWEGMRPSRSEDFEQSPDTGYDKEKLVDLARKMNTLPDKKFFRKIVKLFDSRLKMIEENDLDWAMGELLAYATLLEEGYNVRVSGQDSERGTFSHRHAVLKTTDDEEEYLPLNNLSDKQAKFTIYNSPLSEYGVVGFDYGYAWGNPNGLVIWEAQFGDFNNGAQVIIDQFLSAAEDKWGCQNGLVMLLPHGYEGMGSEHSSARLERYLLMCAEQNMQVCNATTPANFYHLLRRQLHRDFRKPLIVMSPKKLLRYSKATSRIEDMADGRFLEVIDDPNIDPKEVDTLIFCSGKVYYDILEEKERLEAGENMAVIRLEQLYPLPEKQLKEVIDRYKGAKTYLWVQEEPENMGAWPFILRKFRMVPLEVIARHESGSPAAGSTRVHEIRQQRLMSNLFSYAAKRKTEKA